MQSARVEGEGPGLRAFWGSLTGGQKRTMSMMIAVVGGLHVIGFVTLISLVALVISVGITSVFYFRVVRQQGALRPKTRKVLAAATALEAGTPITADNVTEIDCDLLAVGGFGAELMHICHHALHPHTIYWDGIWMARPLSARGRPNGAFDCGLPTPSASIREPHPRSRKLASAIPSSPPSLNWFESRRGTLTRRCPL